MPSVMYVCDVCRENVPEHCGHDDPAELRIVPATEGEGEVTICEGCWSGWDDWHEPGGIRPAWNHLKPCPAFAPVPV